MDHVVTRVVIEEKKPAYDDYRTKYKIPETFTNTEIDSVIQFCKNDTVPEYIAFNTIYSESRFDSTAFGWDGCSGYMQLSPKYFKYKNAIDNLRQGIAFLGKNYRDFGSWREALIFYNSGYTRTTKESYLQYILTNPDGK